MFKSAHLSNNNTILLEDIKGRISKVWSITIFDDNFMEDNVIVPADNMSYAFLMAVIKVYESKKLNVGINLLLCIKYMQDDFNSIWSINNQIDFYSATIPELTKYKNDIEKYSVLM